MQCWNDIKRGITEKEDKRRLQRKNELKVTIVLTELEQKILSLIPKERFGSNNVRELGFVQGGSKRKDEKENEREEKETNESGSNNEVERKEEKEEKKEVKLSKTMFLKFN